MPKVQTFGLQEERTGVAGAARSASTNTAGAKAGALASNLSQLGEGLEIFNERVATTEAEEAFTKLQRSGNDLFFNPENGYFNSSGRNAFDGAQEASTRLADLRKEIESGLSGEAQRKFSRVADRFITNSLGDIDRHASKGFKAWEAASIEATVETTIENAHLYWNNPLKFATERNLGEAAVRDAARIAGIDPRENLQTYRSRIATAAIKAALVTSASEAERLMEDFGPDGQKLLEGDAITALKAPLKVKSDAEKALVLASDAVNAGAGDRARVLGELENIDDPEIKKRARAEAMSLFNTQQLAINERQKDILDRAEAEGLSGAAFQNRYPMDYATLTPLQQKAIDLDGYVRTDRTVLFELDAMTDDEIMNAAVSKGWGDTLTKLSVEDRNAVSDRVSKLFSQGVTKADQNQSGRTRAAQTTGFVKQLLGVEKIKASRRKEANILYEVITMTEQQQKDTIGRDLDAQEYTDMLNGLMREALNPASFLSRQLGWDIKDSITVIDPEDLQKYARELRDAGVPITPEWLFEMHGGKSAHEIRNDLDG